MKKIISVLLSFVLLLSVFPTTVFGATSGDFSYSVVSESGKTCKVTGYSGSSKDVVIPAELNGYKVTAIENFAFYMDKALTIELPATVNSLNGQAFNEMNSTVNSITVAEDSPYYSSVDGVLYNKDKTAVVCYPAGKTGETYTVPDGVETITSYSLINAKFKEIILPNSVKVIESWAFNGCGITEISLPDSVVSIGASAFRNCKSLEYASIPDSVTFIDVAAFYNCTGLKSISLPNSIDSIYGSTFTGCSSLESVSIPESVKSIYSQAFYGCDALTEIVIPDNVTLLEDAFHSCDNLEKVVLSKNITTLESYTFNGCPSLKTIVIPNGVTNIEENVFVKCDDLAIICEDKSVAKTYAVDNGFSYIINSKDTRFDVVPEYIYKNETGIKTDEIVSGSDDITCSADTSFAGTGVVLDVLRNGELHSQYTLIVNGDTNGDGFIDALDAFDVHIASNGIGTLDGVYAIAADTNSDGEIDLSDYAQVVNYVVG